MRFWLAASSVRARRYSFGNTFTKRVRNCGQPSRISRARTLPVCCACLPISFLSAISSASPRCHSSRGSFASCSRSVSNRLEIYHREIAAARERAVFIQHVCDTARHPRREIASGEPEYDDRATGHVLAAVIPDALHDRARSGVPHRKALPGDTAEVRFPADRAVQDDIAGNDVVARVAAEFRRRLHGYAAAATDLCRSSRSCHRSGRA